MVVTPELRAQILRLYLANQWRIGTIEEAQRALIGGQISAGRREVAQLVSSCTSEYRRVKFHARTLTVLDRSLAVYNDALGGSIQVRTDAAVVKLLESAEDSFKSAASFSDGPVQWVS